MNAVDSKMLSVTIVLLLLLLPVLSSSGIGWRRVCFRLLKRDLETWRHNGWVDDKGAAAILAANQPQAIGQRLVFLVALLGALLMLFAAISFVAANWDDMSRLARLSWLVALLWAAYLAGWRLVANGLPQLAEAAFALGVGIFGADIALVAQMYHLDDHPPAAVLLWTLGALATAGLLKSRAALALGFSGATAWTLMELIGYDRLFHGPFLVVWGIAVAIALRLRWWYGYHLAMLSLLAFLVPTLIRFGVEAHWSAHGVVALFIALSLLLIAGALWLQTNAHRLQLDRFDLWLEKYGLIALMITLFVQQTLPQAYERTYLDDLGSGWHRLPVVGGHHGFLVPTLLLMALVLAVLAMVWRAGLLRGRELAAFTLLAAGTLLFAYVGSAPLLAAPTYAFISTWVYGTAFLAFLLWLMTFGHRRLADSYVWAALLGFAIEILYIYVTVFGSLMETSLFFFVGGLLTMLVAFLLYRLHRQLDHGAASAEGRP